MMILLLPNLESAISRTTLITRSVRLSNHVIYVQQCITVAGVANLNNVFPGLKIWQSVLKTVLMDGYSRLMVVELKWSMEISLISDLRVLS